jgi:hypothetical protein
LSWLSDIRRYYRFTCSNCSSVLNVGGAAVKPTIIDELDGKEKYCECCKTEAVFKYSGFKNIDKIGMTHHVKRETYDQNGRKAVKIGNTYMSMSKYNYLETGKIKNEYTPEYETHLRKEEQKNEYLLQTETNKRRAMVSQATQKELDRKISDLPDGEYTVSVEKPAT